MAHWSDEYYRRVDAGDPSSMALLASDIRVQVGNAPHSIGTGGLMEGPLGKISAAKKTLRHELVALHEVDSDRAVIESVAHYQRHDDKLVSLPVVTVIGRNAAGLINELRLYIDTLPLFEGMYATIRMAGEPVLVNPLGALDKIPIDAIWGALVDKAHDATKYVPNITRCVVTDKGIDKNGFEWLLREIIVDGVAVEERVVFYPSKLIVFTRTRGDQMGVIHNIVSEQDGETTLSFSMDLRWYGLADGSPEARQIGEGMCRGYAQTYAQVCANLRARAALGTAA